MTIEEANCSSAWSREQEKAFENALAIHCEDESERWEKIAEKVPGKTAEEIKLHFELLVEDINGIESGLVPLPCYVSSPERSADYSDDGGTGRRGGHRLGDKGSKAEQERRKGIAWTEDEHRLFLLGLEKYGKGDWRSISRNFVISRTPTQVASHAQKYFIRLNSMNKDRRRSSIHDITSVGNGDLSSPQGPIAGQTSVSTVASVKPSKPSPPPPPAPAGVYGTPTIGQPVGGPIVSAVGTPVSIPLHPHMVYGMNGPATGALVTGSPMSVTPLTYPVPHAPRHG